MKVAIAGAGAVGRSIARELNANGHQVLIIDKAADAIRPERVAEAEWLLADCCELSSLEEARLDKCDVVIAATGDDKANLVTSLLAKTEFAVPRTVGRVNHPDNEWLFGERWGVDVAVSTPRLIAAAAHYNVQVIDISSISSGDSLNHGRFVELAGRLGAAERDGESRKVGAFVLKSAGSILASPFTLAGEVLGGD